MNEYDGPRLAISPRLAAYREMDTIAQDLVYLPTLLLRGKMWEVMASGISRREDGDRYVSIPMGDLSEFEVLACRDCLRRAARGAAGAFDAEDAT